MTLANLLTVADGIDVLHLLIPIIILRVLVLFGVKLDKKLILLLSPIALLPDIDFFIFYHRATFHNLFFGVFLVVLAYLLFRKNYPKKQILFIASFFFISHLLLDYGSVMWFYPFQTATINFLGNKVTLEALQILPHYSFQYILKGALEVAALIALLAIEIKFERKR